MSDTNQYMRGVDIIVLFGPTGSGKTTFANIASGDCMRVGRGLTSCTHKVEPTTMFTVDGNPVVVIDSPGFDDTYTSDAEILKSVAGFLSTAYTEKFKVTGLIFMHKITDTRVGGKALLHMRMFKQICGLEALKNVVYVTNMWSEPPTDNELAREAELRSSDQFFGMPLSQGAQMCRHNNTQESAHNIIRKVLPRPPNVTKLAEELNRGVPLEQTRAGAALGLGLEEEIRKLTEELKELREDHAQAIRENNEKHQKIIEDMKRKAESDREILQAEIRSLKQGYQKHREDWSKVTSNLEQKYKEQLQAARKSEDQRMEDLKKAYDKALAEARSQPQNKCIII